LSPDLVIRWFPRARHGFAARFRRRIPETTWIRHWLHSERLVVNCG